MIITDKELEEVVVSVQNDLRAILNLIKKNEEKIEGLEKHLNLVPVENSEAKSKKDESK
jgi:hypothetical protein